MPGPLKADKAVIIEPGQSISSIADELSNERIIYLPTLFKLIVSAYDKIKTPVKSGEYAVS